MVPRRGLSGAREGGIVLQMDSGAVDGPEDVVANAGLGVNDDAQV